MTQTMSLTGKGVIFTSHYTIDHFNLRKMIVNNPNPLANIEKREHRSLKITQDNIPVQRQKVVTVYFK